MNVISRPTLRGFGLRHADAKEWLAAWLHVAERAAWTTLDDVRTVYPSADQVGSCLVFNKGNDYRLIVRVSYSHERTRGTIFLKHFLTHAEYDKNRWKDCCT
jgi:mRNA interferase HigB